VSYLLPGTLVNRAHPLTQSCSLFWVFNNNPYDYIQNQKVSLGSALAYAPTGLYFSGGSSSTTKIATYPSMNLGTIHTLCVRINPAAVSGNVFAGAPSYYAFNLFLGTTIYYAAGSSNNVYVNYTMSLNVPTNFAIVRDNASVSFYVNGVKISPTKTLGSNNNLIISALGGYLDGSNLLNATIEYAAIFSNIASVDIVNQMHADPYAMFQSKQYFLFGVGGGGGGTVYENTITDGFVLSDSTVNNMSFDQVVTDGFKFSDLPGGIGAFRQLASDGLVMGDSASNVANFNITLTDGFKINETVSSIAEFAMSITDGFTLGDMTITYTSDGAKLNFTANGKTYNFIIKSKTNNFNSLLKNYNFETKD
jgi:hypothetical protein